MDPIKMDVSTQEAMKWPQYLAGLLASLPMLCTGSVTSWTSPALAHLQRPGNGTEGLSAHEASWVGSMMPLGAIVGAVPAGFLADLLGRRLLLLLLAVPFLLGWVLVIVAGYSVPLLYTARFISGFAVGATTVAIPLYNEEISEVKIRGMLGCYLDFMITAGFLWCYVINAFVDYFWLTVLCAVQPAVFFLSFAWMPESPVHLLAKGRDDQAEEALRFFRGAKHVAGYDTRPEMQCMREFLKEGRTDEAGVESGSSRMGYIWECLFRRGPVSTTAKAMRIIFGLVIVAQTTGIQGVIYNTVDIFERGEGSLSPYLCNTLIAVIQFVLSLVTLMLVDRVGRKLFLYLSGAGMSISIALLALHFYLKNIDGLYVENFGWVPCISVTLFISTYASGFGPLPWLIMSEIVPTESKAWVGSICVFLSWSLQFIVTKLHIIMITELGDDVTYGLFCVLCVLSTVYVAVWLPETKNKTRAEIQTKLKGNQEMTKL
ncbi:facilitated trehalose transporter Tret1-like [Bacillus rossius redtenbacheri]|uniref:facilitated trehalose transporter Tret1-like n=1 Tax=Bacillus rossius redtenbacheri TaxID=93214 RepID=UPI002FDDBD35